MCPISMQGHPLQLVRVVGSATSRKGAACRGFLAGRLDRLLPAQEPLQLVSTGLLDWQGGGGGGLD